MLVWKTNQAYTCSNYSINYKYRFVIEDYDKLKYKILSAIFKRCFNAVL